MKLLQSLFMFCLVMLASAKTIKERLIESRQYDSSKDIVSDIESGLDIMHKHEESRMRKLEQLLEHRRLALADHDSHRRRLSKEEHKMVQKQAQTYERKLNELRRETKEEREERFMEMMDANLYRLDYVDFDKTGLHN